MGTSQSASPVNLEVIPASPEQQPIVANLVELYCYDFSPLIGLNVGEDGRFGYNPLPLYWTEPGHYPFLVRVDGHWAGFVFVRRGSQISGDENVWDMAEFFVLRGYRRLGIGTKAAHEIWRMFPGKWEVRVIERNEKARDFWAVAVNGFVGKDVQPTVFERDGRTWHVFSFES